MKKVIIFWVLILGRYVFDKKKEKNNIIIPKKNE